MSYIRKTRDIWEIQGYYGSWEMQTTETTKIEAKRMIKCYRENTPNIPHRVVRKKEQIIVQKPKMTAYANFGTGEGPFLTRRLAIKSTEKGKFVLLFGHWYKINNGNIFSKGEHLAHIAEVWE